MRVLYSFIISLSLHLLIVAYFIVDFSFDLKIEDSHLITISLSQADDITDSLEPASVPESIEQIKPQPQKQKAPQPQKIKIPEPEITKEVIKELATEAIEPKYTPADRHLIPRSVIYHYGDEFFELSPLQQDFIIDNFQRIRKINEIVGTKILREEFSEIDPDDNNLVEFTIEPDGSIGDIHLEKSRLPTDLDRLTLKTIRQAQQRYPKPQEATKIRIRVYVITRESD